MRKDGGANSVTIENVGGEFTMVLDYIALFLLIFVGLTLVYGLIFIHDIPYKIAQKRDHPHQDAIHVGGWISLFTLHAIWPFLWIWATLYRPDRGYGFQGQPGGAEAEVLARLQTLETRLSDLESNQASS